MNAVEQIGYSAEGPQPLVRDIPPGQPYPLASLGPLRAAVEAVVGQMQTPVGLTAQSALSVASLAVQGFADVQTLGGPRPTSLFALTIAKSGERKSASDSALMRPLREHEREQAANHRAAVASWSNTHALWKGRRDSILSTAKGKVGNRIDAEADLAELGREPVAPPSQGRTVTEPTFEGLSRMFAEGLPSLGIFSDEGGQFLGGYAMGKDNRQKTLAALNDLWQGNPIRRTRSGDGSYTLFGRRLSAHLMVQPGVARAFMADPMTADTGFLPRFLMCEPPSTIGTRLQANMRDASAELDSYGARMREILDRPLPMDADSRELDLRVLPLSCPANALLSRFADAIESQQAPGKDLAHLTGFASKAAEQAARIAGVLTLWRDLDAPEVSEEDMANGIELAQYYLSEAARLADGATVSADIDMAERLRVWLVETWPEPNILPSDILRRAPVRALRDRKTARKAIAILEEAGWLVPMDPGTVVRGKSRREAYHIVRPADVV